MRIKSNISLIIITTLGLLLGPARVYGEETRATKNLRQETVLLPASAPDKGQLIPIGVALVHIESGDKTAKLTVLYYKDPRTQRTVDYAELYNTSGELLAASWIDRSGIHRTAVDEGLLDENKSELKGVLVLVEEGTAI